MGVGDGPIADIELLAKTGHSVGVDSSMSGAATKFPFAAASRKLDKGRMATTSIDNRLRPLRFGFVVKPNDKTNLKRIFEINTCLWCGKFNPIIPYLMRVPQWWDRHGFLFDSAAQIMNGYVEFFEPDFLVEATPGLANGLGYDPERVLQLNDVLKRSDDRNHRGVGQDVLDLYKKLYREQFQFVRRHPETVIDVSAAGAFGAFAACLFGAFPTDENVAYFHRAFRDVFAPTSIRLDAETLGHLYRPKQGGPPAVSALNLGTADVRIEFGNQSFDPTLLVLDITEAKDLIDYWNFRAIHSDVLPIPVQWLPTLSDFCREQLRTGYRPLPGNPNGVMIRVNTMFSRSIKEEDIEGLFRDHIAVDVPGANCLQTWYPPIWRPSPRLGVRTTRPMLEVERRQVEIQVDDGQRVRFDSLYPEFADRFGAEHRWANVVRLSDWANEGQVATVFPVDVRKKVAARLTTGFDDVVSTTEGLTVYPGYRDLPHYWDLVDGPAAIGRWLETSGVKIQISEAGKATQQIVQTMGGLWGLRAFAHKDIIRLLDHMANTPITHSAHRHEFENRINNAVGKDIWRHRVFETLVDRKAVQLGYELKCPKCGSWSWHSLSQLGLQITCELCLRAFDFPVADPTNNQHARWAYRVIGPFALPNYASGGYAAALALRFFGHERSGVGGSKITWAGGHELTFADGTKAEADFIVWHQRKDLFRPAFPTEVVFGEAKSFGKERIEAQDVQRMMQLAERFPGSIIAFATLKEELSPLEIRLIRRLAEWGREYEREHRRTRAPVIVLTATELFAAHDLRMAWKDKGGRHAKFVEPGWLDIDHLRTVADLTQQLYLGMPSYHSWFEQKHRARRARSQRSDDGSEASSKSFAAPR